jgi:zinc transport system substrate-binding protein
VTFLAGKVDELSLKTILTIEKSDQKIANTIKENSTSKDQQILALDSMQSTTSEDVNNGASYLGIMESNLEVLKKALAN